MKEDKKADKVSDKNTKVKMISAPAIEVEAPIFKTVNNKDYILYGIGNNYPNTLKEMMNQSSLHNAILKKKADMILKHLNKRFSFLI